MLGFRPWSICFLGALILACLCCRRHPPAIAVLPRTAGSTLWEAEHAGADAASRNSKYAVYWNAPTHEDDVEGQIALIEKVRRGSYSGLVLAPDHALALLTPIRRVLATGTPVVIVSSRLGLPPGGNLSYIVTDEKLMGRMAAQRIGKMLGGSGAVALLGFDPGVPGVMSRVRAFEAELNRCYPRIRIVARGAGAFNAAEAQQATIATVSNHPALNAIFSLTAVSTHAAYVALRSPTLLQRVKLIGCEQDGLTIGRVQAGEIDSVLAEDTYAMGFQAIQQIAARHSGRRVPDVTVLQPVLITRENASSNRVRQLTAGIWIENE